ncbi:MAG: helix-turn-helix domain-containing protein [Dermatophilaceae bacterium]
MSHHQVLASTSRMAMLELLRMRAEPLGVDEVARHIGLHQNTVRSHLDLLVDSGLAIRRREAPSGPGRPRVVYEATSPSEGESSYQLLAEVLTQHLVANTESPGQEAVKAGQSWARSLGRGKHAGEGPEQSEARAAPLGEEAAVERVVRMLGSMGFAPELSPERTSIRLHRCPFRELAESRSDVVCGAHLGIIQGALAELGAPVTATRLFPFVEPGLCIATLARPAGPDAPVHRPIPA